jgi:predicted nucleic acid-binding Zn ribbon protein
MSSEDRPFIKKRTGSLSSASEVLQSLFENSKSPLADQFLRWNLWRNWKDIVGPTIAQNTDPVGFDRSTLYVWVKSASWMQELIFISDFLVKTINERVGHNYVKQVRFTLDRRAVPKLDNAPPDMKNFLR